MISDYEKSIIGTFTKGLLEKINEDERMKEEIEVYFTITKFDNDYGFSLIHQDEGYEEPQLAKESTIHDANDENKDIGAVNNEDPNDAINLKNAVEIAQINQGSGEDIT